MSVIQLNNLANKVKFCQNRCSHINLWSDGLRWRVVDYETMRFLIKRSVWWKQPKNGWVRAMGHADNIVVYRNSRVLKFGANYFLIEKAIQSAMIDLDSFVEEFNEESKSTDNLSKLKLEIRHALLHSVSHQNKGDYPGEYPCKNGKMLFGTTAVDIDEFIDALLETTHVINLFE